MKKTVESIDLRVITFFNRIFEPFARISLFVVFFWFGIIKLFGISAASPLAQALTERTIGLMYFDQLFAIIALLECVIGILFLVPKTMRIVLPLLLVHMCIVSAPLILVPDIAWQSFLVPTLEGQYIIKNMALVALAIGIATRTTPLIKKD